MPHKDLLRFLIKTRIKSPHKGLTQSDIIPINKIITKLDQKLTVVKRITWSRVCAAVYVFLPTKTEVNVINNKGYLGKTVEVFELAR